MFAISWQYQVRLSWAVKMIMSMLHMLCLLLAHCALHFSKHRIIIKSNLLENSSNFPAQSAVNENHATPDQLLVTSQPEQ